MERHTCWRTLARRRSAEAEIIAINAVCLRGTRVASRGGMMSVASLVRSGRLFFAAPLVLVACGGSTEPTATSSSSSSGSSGQETSKTSAAAAAIGIYHLDQVDATNLEIRADGAFQWTIEGCDFGGGQCGSWTEANGKLALSGGPPGLEWSHDGSFKARVTDIVVTKTGEDLLVSGLTKDGRAFTQTWKKGRSCAICGGQLGPTGQQECSTPLPRECAQ